MSDAPHLIIPFATSTAPGCLQALQDLALPHLDALLARMAPAGTDHGEESDYALAHERAMAAALGLNASHNGITPWAAWEQAQANANADTTGTSAWAFVTPCQWHVSTDRVTMLDPDSLQLTACTSRTLMEILAPWFAEDGIELIYYEPTRWLARGDAFADIATASLDRVIRRDVRAFMPKSANQDHVRVLHRLQSEMQMLLYTHPVNEARAADDLPPVNSFWIHGAGRLERPAQTVPSAIPQMSMTLRDAALREDWVAWRAAWSDLDAGPVADMQSHIDQGGAAVLTLCGERSAMQFRPTQRSFAQKMKALFVRSGVRLADLSDQL